MGDSIDESKITKFFKENSAQNITEYFKPKTIKISSMSIDVIGFCCEIIVGRNYQCHILNKAMRDCLKEYNKWSEHINGGDKSLTIKMNDNLIILSHEVIQWEKWEKAADDNAWKKRILELCGKTKYGDDFEQLFFSMCYIFSRPSTYFSRSSTFFEQHYHDEEKSTSICSAT